MQSVDDWLDNGDEQLQQAVTEAQTAVQAAVSHPRRIPTRRVSQAQGSGRPGRESSGLSFCGCMLGTGDARPCCGLPRRSG